VAAAADQRLLWGGYGLNNFGVAVEMRQSRMALHKRSKISTAKNTKAAPTVTRNTFQPQMR
jgi:hypothetical protein